MRTIERSFPRTIPVEKKLNELEGSPISLAGYIDIIPCRARLKKDAHHFLVTFGKILPGL
jgi:hypothetical protein